MRDTITRAIILFATQLTTIAAFSQHNNLSAGDIAFVSYQSDKDLSSVQGGINFDNRFSVVVLREGGIPANAILYFTNTGWSASASNFIPNSPDGYISWQAPAAGIRQGAELFFISTEIGSSFFWNAYTSEDGSTIIGTTVSNLNNNRLKLATAGDQLLVYQTGDPAGSTGGYNHPLRRFITAIHANIEPGITSYTSWDGNNPTTISQSSVPAGLLPGRTAFLLSPGTLPGPGDPTTEYDNGKYHCIANGTAFTPGMLGAIIYNPANWTYSNTVFPVGSSSDRCPYLIAEGLLPVRLISFSAQTVRNIVNVRWQTAEETDHDYFEVERSTDGRNYAVLKRIAGMEGTGLKTYEWQDMSVALISSAHVYYRLKIVSLAGKEEYSKTVIIQPDQKRLRVISATEIALDMPAAGKLSLAVCDMSGRTVSKALLSFPKGYSTHPVKGAERLTAGLYFIIAESEGYLMSCLFTR